MSGPTESGAPLRRRHGADGRRKSSTWIGIGAVFLALATEVLLCAVVDNYLSLRVDGFPGSRYQPMATWLVAGLAAEFVLGALILGAASRMRPSALLPCALALTAAFGFVDQIPVLLTLLVYVLGHYG